MKITLINGNPEPDNGEFEAYVKELDSFLKLEGHETSLFNLHKNNIISCTGCWGCWVKTPGECLFEDDTKAIRKEIINSDWVIYLSPLIMGYTSGLMKLVQDKTIPLLHPYIELVNSECHHEKRYEHYPKIGLIYAKEKDTDEEDVQILKDLYKRYALNFKSGLKLFATTENPVKNLIDAINFN